MGRLHQHFRRFIIMDNAFDNGTGNLEAEVRSTVEQGQDIREMVRQLTLRQIGVGTPTMLLDVVSGHE